MGGVVRPVNELIDAGDARAKVVGKRRPPVTSVTEATGAFDRLQRQMAGIRGVLPVVLSAVALAGEEAFLTFETFLPSTALAAEVAKKVGLGWARCLESAAT